YCARKDYDYDGFAY
nr:immunoglobulin heavy chain junction region [Mus musculus]